MKMSDSSDLGRLLNAKQGLRRETVLRCESNPQCAGLLIPGETSEVPRIQGQPETNRRQIDSGSRRIFRFDGYLIARGREIAAEGNPSEVGMFHHIGAGIPGMAKEIRPIVPR